MYLMYVDESGDPGNIAGSSAHYILSGLIINQNDWQKSLDNLKSLRKHLKTQYGLNQRVEIHASELIRIKKLTHYKKIKKVDRIKIIKDYCTIMPAIFPSSVIINICIKKADHIGRDIFELAWDRLLTRFNTYLVKDAKDKGLVIADDFNSIKLMNLQRRMRVFNPIPSHFGGTYNATIDLILEDPFSRSSHHSYFIQTVDIVAHALYRKEYPKGSLKKHKLELQFNKLEPILLKAAHPADPFGIVRN